jgi:hypothetical protein
VLNTQENKLEGLVGANEMIRLLLKYRLCSMLCSCLYLFPAVLVTVVRLLTIANA